MRNVFATLPVLVGCSLLWAQQGAGLTGLEIMRRTDKDHRSRDEHAVVEMVLVARNGERQFRLLEFFGKTGRGDDDLHLIRFLEPPSVRGTGVLTKEAAGRADDQWLYLPALRKTKRIASSQRTQRFMGTDFIYEDLGSEDFEEYDYRLVSETDVKGVPCYVVEAKPRPDSTSAYGKRIVHVEKARFLIREEKYYDKGGRHFKTLTVGEFEQVEGLWRPRHMRMADHVRRTQTIWRFREHDINPGLSDSIFTVRNLERGRS